MKKRLGMLFLSILLATVLTVIGCKEETERNGQGKIKESKDAAVLDWGIAGIWGYDTENAIPEESVDALNQLLSEKGKNYQIRFHVITFTDGQLSEESEDVLRKCDLITIANQYTFQDEVKFYPTLLECEEKNLFEPLDAYMKTEDGMQIKKVMLSDLTLQPGVWKEKQWLLPTSLPVMTGSSLLIDKDLYEKAGKTFDTVPDFTKCDELFELLYQANGKKPFLTLSDRKKENGVNGIAATLPDYLAQMLSGCGSIYDDNGLGVGSLRTEGQDLDTRNLLKEPYFEAYLNAWRRYSEKGYVNPDMDAEAVVELVNSYVPELISIDIGGAEWIIPKSENYVLNLAKQPASDALFNGVGAESKQKSLAFEALADMITEKALNEVIQNIGSDLPSEFVFYTGLSEEGEKEYQHLAESVPQFRREHVFGTFSAPETAGINEVFAEYSTDYGTDSAQKVLEKHFSQNGKVTEKSIQNGIRRLNEKLDAAGMEQFIETLKEHKR